MALLTVTYGMELCETGGGENYIRAYPYPDDSMMVTNVFLDFFFLLILLIINTADKESMGCHPDRWGGLSIWTILSCTRSVSDFSAEK